MSRSRRLRPRDQVSLHRRELAFLCPSVCSSLHPRLFCWFNQITANAPIRLAPFSPTMHDPSVHLMPACRPVILDEVRDASVASVVPAFCSHQFKLPGTHSSTVMPCSVSRHHNSWQSVRRSVMSQRSSARMT